MVVDSLDSVDNSAIQHAGSLDAGLTLRRKHLDTRSCRLLQPSDAADLELQERADPFIDDPPFEFQGGTIDRVAIDVTGDSFVDHEKEVLAYLARD